MVGAPSRSFGRVAAIQTYGVIIILFPWWWDNICFHYRTVVGAVLLRCIPKDTTSSYQFTAGPRPDTEMLSK